MTRIASSAEFTWTFTWLYKAWPLSGKTTSLSTPSIVVWSPLTAVEWLSNTNEARQRRRLKEKPFFPEETTSWTTKS